MAQMLQFTSNFIHRPYCLFQLKEQFNLYAEFVAVLSRLKNHVSPGEKLIVTTPMEEFTRATNVTFKTLLSTEVYDVLPSVKVFLDTEAGTQREPLLEIRRTWRLVETNTMAMLQIIMLIWKMK